MGRQVEIRRMQLVCNTFMAEDGLAQPWVEVPGHLLYLTNGGVRICHWLFKVPRDYRGLPLDGGPADVRIPGLAIVKPPPLGPWGDFVNWAMEEHPDRVRVGVDPGAPYDPCPFISL